ncbi:MAG TPA: ferritin-like fold-containing protein [Dermatophilaceae bacterium]|nr:ferritin-like fold-containing protein [Dermatophilaceae bacterium]
MAGPADDEPRAAVTSTADRGSARTTLGDPAYRGAVVDLLGVLAYGELTAFSRLAADAELAPTGRAKVALARVAVAEFRHFEDLSTRLTELGEEPEVAMRPFVAPIDGFHARTRPNDWLEGLVKAYVGGGIATDFYREVSAYLDPATRALVVSVLEDVGIAEFVVEQVRDAIDADATIGGRLALWGRRLVGEALSQAQQVAGERDGLSSLLVGGADLAELGRMLGRLTEAHTHRMQRLGLAA